MRVRRLICPDVRKIEVEEFELGLLPDNGILIGNEYTAISVGTEVYSWAQGGEPGTKSNFPRQTGYCNAGVVLEVGKDVSSVKPGDRICGQASHASHVILPEGSRLHQIVPQNVSSKGAAFMVMGAIAMHGMRVASIVLGEAVVVVGLGIVGQLAATLAQLCGGMPVIVIDLDDFRIDKAGARGIDICINPKRVEDIRAAVREHCTEDGANVVIEATGKPAVYPMAVKLACTAGRVVALGSPRGTVEMDFLADVHLREVSILGAIQPITPDGDHVYYRWAKGRDRNLFMRLMSSGKLTVEDLITHVMKPDQCQETYSMLADTPQDALGVVFDWT
jgi:2-desacetyl-2-hydroxyethyl bacteriochlorophyllide A dehydrogenase